MNELIEGINKKIFIFPRNCYINTAQKYIFLGETISMGMSSVIFILLLFCINKIPNELIKNMNILIILLKLNAHRKK